MAVKDLATIGERIDTNHNLFDAVIQKEGSDITARDRKGELIDSGGDFGLVAIDAAAYTGECGIVAIRPGNYAINTPIVMKDESSLRYIGSGVGSTILTAGSGLTSRYFFEAPSERGSYYTDGVHIAHMSLYSSYGGGIKIDGWPIAPARMKYHANLHDLLISHKNLQGIYLANHYDSSIRRVNIAGPGESGNSTHNVYLRSVYRFELDKCLIHNPCTYDNLYISHSSARGVIRNCEFQNWARYSVNFTNDAAEPDDGCSAISVENCRFIENRSGGSTMCIIVTAKNEDIYIRNNEFEINTDCYGVYVGGNAPSDDPTVNINILNNTFNGCANVTGAYVVMIQNEYCDGTIVRGNIFDSAPRISDSGDDTIIEDNIGYNPRGNLTPPAANPANGVTYTNTYACPCLVTISGGTVTGINVAGQATGLTSGAFVLAPGQTIVVTQTVNPTWYWIGL